MRLIVKLAGVCCAMVLSLGSGVAAAAPTDPDATFAGGGATTIPFAQGRSDARGLTLAPDGKIVAVGERLNMSNLQDWVVSRSLADGSPDISFNGNGRSQPVETSPVTGVFASGGQSVAVQGDGNIVVSGQTNGPIKVGRLHGDGTTDGQPDNTFGTAGLASITIPQSTRTEGRAIALQPDGKILVAGTAFVGGHQSVFLARFTSAGVPDVTFSASGAVFAPDAACDQLPEGVPTDCEAHSIALEPGSGSTPAAIYVGGGNVQGNVIGGRVFKFSPASGDTGWGIEAGYGTAGAAQIDRTAANEVYALLRQSDGRLVAVGDAQTG
ncbi:MAG: hypothetical protein QOF76_2279, partial [Solirubrobacteraceae bacterium]|nr:hypothetical protein [Solirubrobacteraceae bacterium]